MFGQIKQRAHLQPNSYGHVYNIYPPVQRQTYPHMISPNMMQQMPQGYPQTGTGEWGNPYLQEGASFYPNYPNQYPVNQPHMQTPGMMQNYMGPQGYPPNQMMMQAHAQTPGTNNYAHSIFQNPLEPETPVSKQPQQANYYMNPYPKQSFIPKNPSGVQSIMNSFKGQDGSLDINKMVNTAGQMLNAVNQVSSMVKGIGGIIKV